MLLSYQDYVSDTVGYIFLESKQIMCFIMFIKNVSFLSSTKVGVGNGCLKFVKNAETSEQIENDLFLDVYFTDNKIKYIIPIFKLDTTYPNLQI